MQFLRFRRFRPRAGNSLFWLTEFRALPPPPFTPCMLPYCHKSENFVRVTACNQACEALRYPYSNISMLINTKTFCRLS